MEQVGYYRVTGTSDDNPSSNSWDVAFREDKRSRHKGSSLVYLFDMSRGVEVLRIKKGGAKAAARMKGVTAPSVRKLDRFAAKPVGGLSASASASTGARLVRLPVVRELAVEVNPAAARPRRARGGHSPWIGRGIIIGVGFPRIVNEKAARTVAAAVALTGIVALATGWHWLLAPLALGFWARVLAGPRYSPFALLATRVIAPRLGLPRDVAGPPKRFAQGMGAAITTAGVIALALGWTTVTTVLLALLVTAATLESVFALCIGCQVFALLIRSGLLPETVCMECADISRRLARV